MNHRRMLALLFLAAPFACTGATGPFATLSASNNVDAFDFVAQTYDHTSTTTTRYAWIHNSAVAQVKQGPPEGQAATPLTGTATVTIKDAAGKEVYTHDLKENLSDTTMVGAPGTWTIDLAFVGARGDVILSVLKAPRDLTVAPNTTGTNRDANGYTVTLDGATMQTVALDATFTFNNLSAGSHTVVLSGVAGNCTVTDGPSRTLTVPAGVGATATFAIACT
jgi:hypothetical protein